MRFAAAFGRFWWDFVVGDDWRLAAAVVGVLAAGAAVSSWTSLSDTAISLLAGASIMVLVAASIVAGALRECRARRG